MNLTVEKKRILVVDDEPYIRESLQLILSRKFNVDAVEGGEEAIEFLKDNNKKNPDLLLVDVMMPGVDGIKLLEAVRKSHPEVLVIMLTASSSIQNAVSAMKLGAIDYLSKPYDVDELFAAIDKVLHATDNLSSHGSSQLHFNSMQREGIGQVANGDFGRIVGRVPSMQNLYDKIELLCHRDTSVLITGESGTGKELVAREIHERSKRASSPFIAINCGAIPENLVESELFGHERGSFTGALTKKIGQFELAHHGTLFLDEVGELSQAMQVKLLRFLQEREFFPVGSPVPVKVDVRIISATNKPLEQLAREGIFRQDLLYRINVVNLDLVPLRERREDIPQLISLFLQRISKLYGGRELKFLPETMKLLTGYSWPGNVRELENFTESLLALCLHDEISPNDLPSRIHNGQMVNVKGQDELKIRVLDGDLSFEDANRAFEAELIIKALEKSNYVQTSAARMLGVSRRILKYKMDKFGISENAGKKTEVKR